ncbi:unnamed protein product [Musa textilis]
MARRGVPLLGDSSTPVDHALGLVEASAFDVQGGCVKATAERLPIRHCSPPTSATVSVDEKTLLPSSSLSGSFFAWFF